METRTREEKGKIISMAAKVDFIGVKTYEREREKRKEIERQTWKMDTLVEGSKGLCTELAKNPLEEVFQGGR